MEHPERDAVVSQHLRRLWVLLSEMDAAHVARLANVTGKPHAKASHGRRAA